LKMFLFPEVVFNTKCYIVVENARLQVASPICARQMSKTLMNNTSTVLHHAVVPSDAI